MASLGAYQAGNLSVGQPKIGELVAQGKITHIAYLQRAIEQLGRVIGAFQAEPVASIEQRSCQ